MKKLRNCHPIYKFVFRLVVGHAERLTSLREKLSQRLDAQSTAEIMSQHGALKADELEDIQVEGLCSGVPKRV